MAYAPVGKFCRAGWRRIFYNRPLLRTIDDFTLGQQQLFFDTNSLSDPLTGKLMTAGTAPRFYRGEHSFPANTRC